MCAYNWEHVFNVICQTTGDYVTGPAGTTPIWDRLIPPDNQATAYVSDYYLDTTNQGDYSPNLNIHHPC